MEVFVGVDMAKGEHYTQAITTQGVELFSRPVSNDQAAIEAMLNQASAHGRVAIVVDMTSSGAQLLLGVMAQQGVPVAYVNGLVMRRAADLYTGSRTRRWCGNLCGGRTLFSVPRTGTVLGNPTAGHSLPRPDPPVGACPHPRRKDHVERRDPHRFIEDRGGVCGGGHRRHPRVGKVHR